MEDPEEQAKELIPKWVNGHKNEVMRELGRMSSMRAACVSAIMCEAFMNSPPDEGQSFIQAQLFINTMKERLL